MAKYQEIQGLTYKFTYYGNEIIKAKEQVLPQKDGTYSSLDFYEEFYVKPSLTALDFWFFLSMKKNTYKRKSKCK